MAITGDKAPYVSTTNACKLCSPLGACIAFKGVEGLVPLIHGSQGCGTYIRRYIISHYREPMDVASSNFTETSAVFGGGPNLKISLRNVAEKYNPVVIGVATSCLAETMGDDVDLLIKEYQRENKGSDIPLIIGVSTPSYAGTHMDGFNRTVAAIVETIAKGGRKTDRLNIMPGFLSAHDIRYVKEILDDFKIEYTLLPDYSDTLDGPATKEYEELPKGGTPISSIAKMGCARVSVQFSLTIDPAHSAASALQKKFGVSSCKLAMPIGVNLTDRFFRVLNGHTGRNSPRKYSMERGRLIDSYVDGHKYVFGKRAVVYGEEDLVIGISAFLEEIGIVPVLCASGGQSGKMLSAMKKIAPKVPTRAQVMEGVDFYEIAEAVERLSPDLIIGNSKGYGLARKLNIPLIRVGFPIHDRIGSQRVLHVGYRGAQMLFDRIVNAILEKKQTDSPIGYSYM